MFADVEADVYVLVDGDDTYDAAAAPEMMRLLVEDGLDMVCASWRRRRNVLYPGRRRIRSGFPPPAFLSVGRRGPFPRPR
jgi:hypothetical protein